MKTVASILLIILSIPLFLIALIGATIRFQLLTPGFWQATFEKNNTYAALAEVFKGSLENQVVKSGGAATDVSVLTDLITPENVKDFVNKNLENILAFANARSPVLNIYIPIRKIPKYFLPPTFSSLSESVSLSSLLSTLNVQGVNESQIQNISRIGNSVTLILVFDVSLLILFIFLLFVLTSPGGRFMGPGIVFILEGLLSISLYQVGSQIGKAMARDLVTKGTTGEALLGTIAPPVLAEILKIWAIAGLVLVICGIVLLFLKKSRL